MVDPVINQYEYERTLNVHIRAVTLDQVLALPDSHMPPYSTSPMILTIRPIRDKGVDMGRSFWEVGNQEYRACPRNSQNTPTIQIG